MSRGNGLAHGGKSNGIKGGVLEQIDDAVKRPMHVDAAQERPFLRRIAEVDQPLVFHRLGMDLERRGIQIEVRFDVAVVDQMALPLQLPLHLQVVDQS